MIISISFKTETNGANEEILIDLLNQFSERYLLMIGSYRFERKIVVNDEIFYLCEVDSGFEKLEVRGYFIGIVDAAINSERMPDRKLNINKISVYDNYEQLKALGGEIKKLK
jgi:hypothetical protein